MAAISSCNTNNPLPSTQRLLGKVALVTGGANGIGESIVRSFHKHGAKVCLVDISDEAGQRVCHSLGEDANICYLHCDVTKEDDVKRAVDFTVGKFGTLDIIVNNAGVADSVLDILNVDCSDLEKVLNVNVKGVFFGMKHAARIMIPLKKGSIISLCSAAVVVAGASSHAYTASKHAVLGLTKTVAAELGQHGIRVNCVSPYAVPTNLTLCKFLAEKERTNDAIANFQAFLRREANLQGVELTAEDVANAVVFLASDEARYISAENLVIDGGFGSVKHSLRTFK
ncbi:hypothetical protein BVRB_3g055210 [Beta vulgaris subsp. vulgaris]|uniref:zerumbone synthase n=1 Tax=Beta vulgaris subsp. vulgaris TaxID=3555 RepID=UPI0005401412|nr:zerumbone synthase [Beta vulgaris subsp. vulgaris]KMT16376.1 hypothetical protein BVRB_3g055210 [Beta vulgaris subsp. vulgaris]